MAASLVLILPLPPVELSPNRNPRLNHKIAVKNRYKSHCMAEIDKQLSQVSPIPFIQATASITFMTRASTVVGTSGKRKVKDGLYRPRDVDNALASIKYAIDALRGSGVILDDRQARFKIAEVTINSQSPNGPGIRIALEETAQLREPNE